MASQINPNGAQKIRLKHSLLAKFCSTHTPWKPCPIRKYPLSTAAVILVGEERVGNIEDYMFLELKKNIEQGTRNFQYRSVGVLDLRPSLFLRPSVFKIPLNSLFKIRYSLRFRHSKFLVRYLLFSFFIPKIYKTYYRVFYVFLLKYWSINAQILSVAPTFFST